MEDVREAGERPLSAPDPGPSASFFEYGEVTVSAHDDAGREAALFVCMPACLMQAVTPALLWAGLIDKYEVRLPVAAWIPKIAEDRFKPEALDQAPGLSSVAMNQVSKLTRAMLDMFVHLFSVLKDPSDAVPMLPLGTYVTFQYRCRTDALAQVLIHLDAMPVFGVAEFRYALAKVLAFLLSQEGSLVRSGL